MEAALKDLESSGSAIAKVSSKSVIDEVIVDDDPNEEAVALINKIAYNYVSLFIIAVGIVGNILNLIVLTRPKLKGVMYVYLLGLAVSNLCVLIIAIPAVISITASECSGSYAQAYFHAHLMMPLLNCFMAWSVYIIICMTVNRYISIYMPTYFQRIHTFKNAYVAIFFSFMGGVLLHVPLCFENVVVPCTKPSMAPVVPVVTSPTPGDINCTYKASTNSVISEHPLYNVYLWVSETLLRLGPIVTLTILNILIIVRYNRIARKREVLKGTPAVHRTPTTKNGASTNELRRSASPLNGNNGHASASMTNGSNGKLLLAPPLTTDTTNLHPISISVDRPTSNVEADPKTTTTALVDHLTPLTKPRSARGTPNRVSTRRRGLHNPEERMLVVVLIAIVVLFVVCTTPAAFLTLSITAERKKHVGFSVYRACANNLELVGFALNFFVYCLCSADIRRAFVDVLFDNWLVLWMRQKLAKSGSPLEVSEEQHEMEPIDRSAVVASIHSHKLLKAANV